MSTEESVRRRRLFRSTVIQSQVDGPVTIVDRPLPYPVGENELPLTLRFYKQIRIGSPVDDSVTVFEQELVESCGFLLNFTAFKLQSYRPEYTTLLTDTLSERGVPEVEQPAIIQNIFGLVDDMAVSGQKVDVSMFDITEYFSANVSAAVDEYESILIDMVTRESMEIYRARLKPANKSSIEALEKLRLLDDSLELQAIIAHTPTCPICLERLDHLDAAATEEEEEEEEEAIPAGNSHEEEARPKKKRKDDEEEEEAARPKKRRKNVEEEEDSPKENREYEGRGKVEEARPRQIRKSKQREAVDVHHPRMITITRLPCLHHYHGDCIVHWLEINHVCPMCRYPMPMVDAAEASKPSQP